MPVTNNHETPNRDHDIERNVSLIYIEYTKGIWLRHHIENKEIELWFNGEFQMAWAGSLEDKTMDPHVATAMMAHCITLGKKLRSKEISDLLKG